MTRDIQHRSGARDAEHGSAWSPAGLWRRWRARRSRSELELDLVRRRLELLLRAMYDRPLTIADADDPRERGWGARLRRLASGRPASRAPLPATDGEQLYLPRALPARGAGGADAALARYRLLAMEQAERVARGTAQAAPAGDPLERDLYLLSEAAAVDAAIARAMPGVAAALAAARAAALAARPAPARLSAPERDVESLVRHALAGTLAGTLAGAPGGAPGERAAPRAAASAPPSPLPLPLPRDSTPADSREGARAEAARIRARH
ncbi:MAG TPA: hypothetical protein VF041_16455, partial [Gemmatimonadaceae bacterium]